MVLYTDGITEAANSADEQYGLERLCEVVRKHWVKSAEAMDVKVAIAVLDPRGDLIALHRMDGALWRSVPISQGKAAASAAWDAPSGDLRERWDQPVLRALSMMENGRLIPWPGAVPVHHGDELVGAVGVSGARPEQDEEIAKAGVAALRAPLATGA